MKGERFYLQLLVIIFTAIAVLLAVVFAVDLATAKDPATGKPVSWSELQASAPMARALTSPCARAANNLIAMLLTFIGLAIPITANLYTPKLIEIFVRDKVNLCVLGFFSVYAAHTIFAASTVWDNYFGRLSIGIDIAGAIFGWGLLIPYYFYVLRFLNPVTIIERVKELILVEFRNLDRIAGEVRAAQQRLNQKVLHLGSVIIRAVERADRDVSLDAIRALEEVVFTYQHRKSQLPQGWLEAPAELFTGLSEDALEFLRTDRTWFEHKCLTQLSLAYNAALAKMPDAVSAISDALRTIALHARSQGDRATLMLAIRFFNTFVREAIKKKDVHAIYDIMHQYKVLSRDLMPTHSDVVLEIARHLKYYADFARLQGMPFIYELSSYELGEMVMWAYEREISTRDDLLAIVLGFEGAAASTRLVKSRAILAGYFLEHAHAAPADRVRESLEGVPAAILEQALGEILNTRERSFWEVTDRQVNFDYVDERQKQRVRSFFEDLLGRAEATR